MGDLAAFGLGFGLEGLGNVDCGASGRKSLVYCLTDHKHARYLGDLVYFWFQQVVKKAIKIVSFKKGASLPLFVL